MKNGAFYQEMPKARISLGFRGFFPGLIAITPTFLSTRKIASEVPAGAEFTSY
jgi:hypothetical protein